MMAAGPARSHWRLGWQASFIPESDNVMYKVRVNGDREYVLNSEPGFRHFSREVQSYEFASLTGRLVRIRYTRWPGTQRGER
jgi:hypothetical protein